MADNNTIATELEIVDIDVYGRTDNVGNLILHNQDYAISNCLVFWLTSKAGDYIYFPELGGPLERLKFKLMNLTTVTNLTTFLSNTINEYFGNVLTLQSVIVSPDNKKRILFVEVQYISKVTNDPNKVNFTIKKSDTPVTNNTRYPVPYVGDNLVNFVLTQIVNYQGQKLTFSDSENNWIWGPFIFTNLNDSMEEFTIIQDIINNGV